MRFADAVINPDSSLCETLAGLAAHYWKTYCFPSQEKLCELHQKFTGRVMSRRTLNRHLNALERDGQLRRIRRHLRDPRRGFVLRSTLYVICGRFLGRMRRIVAAAARFAKMPDKSCSGVRVPKMAHNLKPSLKGYISSA